MSAACEMTIGSITVTHNSGSVIDQHLESLANLSGLDNIVIVDNDSTDNTGEKLQRFAAVDTGPVVKVHRSPDNLGFGSANNLGAVDLDTDLLLLVNPDVFIEDSELLLQAAESFVDPDVAMVGCALYRLDGTLDHACKRGEPTLLAGLAYQIGLDRILPRISSLSRYRATEVDEADVAPIDAVNGAFMLVRKSMFDACGGFDERFWMYAEDLDLCREIRERDGKILYRGDLRATHLKGGSSAGGRTGRSAVAFYESSVLYYRKWYGPRSARARLISLLVWPKLAIAKRR